MASSFSAYDNISAKSDRYPIEKFNKGDGAESKTQAKQSSYLGDEVNPAHVLTPSVLLKEKKYP